MKFTELPQEVQDRLNEERKNLHLKNENGRSHLCLYDKKGIRFFWAHYHPGAGRYEYPYWSVHYGPMHVVRTTDKHGNETFELRKDFKKSFYKSFNGRRIPDSVRTKKEAIEVARSIGIFDI